MHHGRTRGLSCMSLALLGRGAAGVGVDTLVENLAVVPVLNPFNPGFGTGTMQSGLKVLIFSPGSSNRE